MLNFTDIYTICYSFYLEGSPQGSFISLGLLGVGGRGYLGTSERLWVTEGVPLKVIMSPRTMPLLSFASCPGSAWHLNTAQFYTGSRPQGQLIRNQNL